MGACGSKEASRPVKQPAKVQRTTKPPATSTTKKANAVNVNANAKPSAKTSTKGKTTDLSGSSSGKKAGIKSETRRLGTKGDDVPATTTPTTVPVAADTIQSHMLPEVNSEPVSVSRSTNTAREMAARAAESRLQQQKKGQLGKKLEAERKKNHKDFAMEEYAAKAKA